MFQSNRSDASRALDGAPTGTAATIPRLGGAESEPDLAPNSDGGTPNALEGTTVDDLARSKRDITTAPFRQEFLGGGTAPLGYIISMAAPPSIPYDSSTASAEFDVSFTILLVGQGGNKSVNWSTSVRIANGKVTANMAT